MEIVKNYNQFVNKLFSNKHFVTILSLLIALYASFAAPKLPNVLIKFFNNDFAKVTICFLIAYTASANLNLSVMIALLFLISTGLLNKLQLEQFLMREHYNNMCGASVSAPTTSTEKSD